MLDLKPINARIEPGAIIREQVEIGDNAVIMMGAIHEHRRRSVGAGTMIDMGAVLGGRATVGKNCHVGAGAVLAGVVEPASATPVIVEDNVLIGANAVVIEGVPCRQGRCHRRRSRRGNRRGAGHGGGRVPRQGHQDEGRENRREDRAGRRPAGPGTSPAPRRSCLPISTERNHALVKQ